MRAISDIDWQSWVPTHRAVLLFVIHGGQVLLIRKKRGLGAGKINAPGGRIEAGESPEQAAIRESQEEVGVTPIAPRRRGRLRLQFVDGYSLECYVFSADRYEGTPAETEEALPLWTHLSDIPYDQMWADDSMWLPLMLAGRPFDGRFVFEGDAMLAHDLVDDDPAAALFSELRSLQIPYDIAHHPPVFTVAEAKRHRADSHQGAHIKNLFLRSKAGQMFLITVDEERPVDLKQLGKRLGVNNFSFASFDRLRTYLGVEPGSVSPLAVLNDRERVVTVVLDRSIVKQEQVWCHPLTNDRTIALQPADLLRFLDHLQHPPQLIDFDQEPARDHRTL